MRARAYAAVALLGFAGCAQYAEVRPRRPVLPQPPGTGELLSAERAIAKAMGPDHRKPLAAIGDCLDALSPRSRFVNAINTLPIIPGVPYNTIIGDRGRGDSPNSSDGYVPYWSSYLDGAQTEHIVPSGHSAHQDPLAIAEVPHILKAHAH